MKGQPETMGIAMQRALLGEIGGTCITSERVPHEYSTIVGLAESVHDMKKEYERKNHTSISLSEKYNQSVLYRFEW